VQVGLVVHEQLQHAATHPVLFHLVASEKTTHDVVRKCPSTVVLRVRISAVLEQELQRADLAVHNSVNRVIVHPCARLQEAFCRSKRTHFDCSCHTDAHTDVFLQKRRQAMERGRHVLPVVFYGKPIR
jgi:hypothetical protein